MRKSPIFIFGNRRSGTTLLRLMLTSHPQIAIPPEGGFIIWLGWKYDHYQTLSASRLNSFVKDLFETDNIQDWDLCPSEVQKELIDKAPLTFPQAISEVYNCYLKRHYPDENRRWGDKTTWYQSHINQVNRYFPDMQGIHIVRDVRAVAASYQKVSHLPDHVIRSGLDWMWSNERIEDWKRKTNPDRHFLIRYEDLVQQPEESLKGITSFLGVEYNPVMLDFWKINRNRKLEPDRHMMWKSLTKEKITENRINHWRKSLRKDEIQWLEILSGRTLQMYGYLDHDEIIQTLRSLVFSIFYKVYYFYRMTRNKIRVLKHRRKPGR